MFFYDFKFKTRLPYYDTFPLVLPLELMKGGFIGLNFHYLPGVDLHFYNNYNHLLVIQSLTNQQKYKTYQQVKSNKYVKASIKRYLYSHVRSNFLRVNVDEMALAAYLPVGQFQGATLGQVFVEVERHINGQR